jgi:hypothetical protein
VIKKALVQQVFGQALSRFSLARLPFFPKDTGFAGETSFLNPILFIVLFSLFRNFLIRNYLTAPLRFTHAATLCSAFRAVMTIQAQNQPQI